MSKKMSINVTVNGHPVCLSQSRMVLSDSEQIKRNEYERRRRLRLEQVRQQSKELSAKVLKRASKVVTKELSKLQRDSKSEMKKMHDMKIMEIQRKYQEDMEDIGFAHSAAALQPDADAVIAIDQYNNRSAAAERGTEAAKRLKESAQKENPVAARQARLHQVREVENIRSAMVAKLPSKPHSSKSSGKDTDLSEEGETIAEEKSQTASNKKKPKKAIGKKSPAKVLSKSNVKIVSQHLKSKSPRVLVEAHRGNPKSPKRPTSSRSRKINGGAAASSDKSKSPGKASTSIATDVECTNFSCGRDADDLEPRKSVPTIKLTPTKADKVARYNPEDYKQKTSASNSSSSSTVSDDSSYFSDGCGEFLLPKTTPKHHTSLTSCRVQLYDHSTRQRNSYDQPIGLVERIDLRNEPNAVDAAREITEAENLAANLLESRRLAAQRRCSDAVLRERVKRNYNEMLKNFQNMSRDERVPKSYICTNEPLIDSRRKNCHTEREENTESDFDIILHDTNQPGPSRGPDRIVNEETSSPDDQEQPTICRRSTRHVPSIHERPKCCMGHDSTVETLETWRKIEQHKRVLLREFGSDLPNTIFLASMTPLFDNRQAFSSAQQAAPPTVQAKTSPEIKIINLSGSDENHKKASRSKKKLKKTPKTSATSSKTTETAVQTSTLDEIGAAKDQCVQVEIITEDTESRRKSEMPKARTQTPERHEHVEPRVIVRTPPEVGDSSSGSSISRDILIELEDREVRVTPRKRKSSMEKSSKSASRARSKPGSLPPSHPDSPVKNYQLPAPSSRSASPKRQETASSGISRSPENVVDIVINKRTVKVQAGPSRPFEIINESIIDSSMAHSTPQTQESINTSGKPYRIFKHPTVKKIHETSKDISDTSTSYASLPPKISAAVPSSRLHVTPILEMLDSSTSDSLRAARMNISPVSTPPTPSSSIMNVSSNMPGPERIVRILRFGNSTNGGTTGEESTLPSSTQNENSSSTDPSSLQTRDGISVNHSRNAHSRRSAKSTDHCSCANPTCQLLHDNINGLRDYANHPEVQEKFEDLQNVCTERIASLTELIQRVRNEQRGMEFSMISPADETSLMQLPPPQPLRSDFQSVQRLVESIEAIHKKLAKTLLESQKIITNGTGSHSQTPENLEMPASSTFYGEKSKGSTGTSTEETPVPINRGKPKPRVISTESVHIDLERLKRSRGPYTAMVVTTENPQWPSTGTPRHHEEIVAKLYQEILEQSKTIDNSGEENRTSGDGSLSRQRTPSPPQNIPVSKTLNSPHQTTEDEVTKDEHQSSRPKKDEEFVPLLAGIPKIPRALPSVQPGMRPRPPPAGGPYRSELLSPRHELSTIVEFDTPDTVNRSQGSTRSPSGKSRRVLQLQSPSKSTRSSPRSEKNVKTQTTEKQETRKEDSPMSENIAGTIPRRLTTRDVGSPDDKFVLQSDNDTAMSDRGTTKSLLSQGANTSIKGCATRIDEDGKSSDRLTNGVVQNGARDEKEAISNGGSRENVDDKLSHLFANKLNIDSGFGHENKTEKLTSTSSTSFSGLSGISEIVSSPTSELIKWASSSEEIETALKKLGLGWAIVTLKKTREASALSSSSNSDLTPVNTARRTKSPGKKQLNDDNLCGLPDFSDVSSISIKEASKSTERAVLMKARTSTPNIQNSNSTSEKSASATTSSSGISVQDQSDSLTAPNLSLTHNKR